MESKMPLTVARSLFDLKEKLGEFEYQLICGDVGRALRVLGRARDKMDELFRLVAEHHGNSTPKNCH
ncbi:MAG: hypothetical protein ABIE47_01530 [Pseudomonadota bacterium]